MILRDECAVRDCGHAKETHMREVRSTGDLEEPLVAYRGACTAAWCGCICYVPPARDKG